jgi:hypothetical protein
MQAGLSGLMSDELRASIHARTHSALQMRAENNHSTGGKVSGYDTKGQVIEAEAVIVREDRRSARCDSQEKEQRTVLRPPAFKRASGW